MLAVNYEFLGIPFADDDGTEKVMAVAAYGGPFVPRRVASKKLVREVVDKLADMLLLPSKLALKVVNAVFCATQKRPDVLCCAEDFLHV